MPSGYIHPEQYTQIAEQAQAAGLDDIATRYAGYATLKYNEASELDLERTNKQLESLTTSGLTGEDSIVELFFGFNGGGVSEWSLKRINEKLGIPDIRTMPPKIIDAPHGEPYLIRHELDPGRGIVYRLELQKDVDEPQVEFMRLYGLKQLPTQN